MGAITISHAWTNFNFLIILIFVISSFFFNQCDARSRLAIFKLKERMTLSNYNTEIDSFDLPTLDAYDPNFLSFESPPLNQNLPPLIAPLPSLTTPTPSPSYENSRAPSPPVYGSFPTIQSPIESPHYGPTQPIPPRLTLRPVGAPTQSPSASPSPSNLVWCVARPTISGPLLQRAMDYACGAGADCGPVKPHGPCFGPNTIVAHASYAFNSYWQRTKSVGGTCDFGGIAMLINVNPSYDGCQFLFN